MRYHLVPITSDSFSPDPSQAHHIYINRRNMRLTWLCRRRKIYQAFFQKVLDESPPYASSALSPWDFFLIGGGVGPASPVVAEAADADSCAVAGAGAGAAEGASAGTLRSVLTGRSKSSRRPPLKRSKSSSWEGWEVTAAAAAADDQSLEAP